MTYLWKRWVRVGDYLCLLSCDVPRVDGIPVIPWLKNGRVHLQLYPLAQPPGSYPMNRSPASTEDLRVWVKAEDFAALSDLLPEYGEFSL